MNKKHPCEGCVYWSLSGHGTLTTCDYILITGHSRPCPPGKDCKVKKTRKNKRRPRCGNTLDGKDNQVHPHCRG